MKFKLNTLLNIRKYQRIMDSFSKLCNVSVYVIDGEGTILINSGVQDYNLNYIIAQSIYNKSADIFSLKESKYIKTFLDLFIYAIPIEYDDENYGSIILGPVFFEKKKTDFFRKEIQALGFDYDSLVKSFAKIPHYKQKDFDSVIDFVVQFKDYVVDKIIERKIRNEIESQFKKAQQIAHVGNWEWDLATHKTKWSAEFARLFGISYTTGVFTIDEILNAVHPDDKEELFDIYNNSILNYSTKEHVYRIVRRDNGETRFVYHKWEFQKDKNGIPIKLIGVVQDITELKKAEDEKYKSEEKFRVIFENAGIGIFLADLLGNIHQINGAFKQMIGYEDEEILGKNLKDFVYPDDYKIEWDILSKKVLVRKERYMVEKRLVAKNGNLIWVQLTISGIKDEKGNFLYSIIMAENITDRKIAIEKTEKMNNELKELNATKDKFFSIIAHDLKSPFMGMIGLSEMLIDPLIYLTESERKRRLSILHSAIVKQYELLQNLLGWAQMQLGKITYNPEKIYLDEFSKNVISSLYANAERKNIIILNEIENKAVVFADSNMLRSILQNLITNAVKFTKNNGFVRISSENKNEYVNISIEDNGIGISEENIMKILNPKYHFTTEGTNGEPGTGLGVLLCNDMIEKNKGKLNIISQQGKGTIVTFSLPLAAEIQGMIME